MCSAAMIFMHEFYAHQRKQVLSTVYDPVLMNIMSKVTSIHIARTTFILISVLKG
jgi:hypothetical protein